LDYSYKKKGKITELLLLACLQHSNATTTLLAHQYPFHHQNTISICYPTVTSYCSFTALHFVLQHSIFTLNVITLFPTGHFVAAMLPLMLINKYVNKSVLVEFGDF
jgi:hypothetical protein